MEQVFKIIESFNLSEEDKQVLRDALKKAEKKITVAEFKYNRTLIDKSAITNVLNASLKEMEIQKKQIELAKNEINQNLIELDKQKKIADKQASLNRVRAEIASMRTSNDLELIIPLIWRELKYLGIPFLRCGVFIMDEDEKQIHTFLSSPQGKAITAFHIPFSTPNLVEMLQNWKAGKTFITHWNDSTFSILADTLLKNGSIPTRQHYLKNIPKEGLFLHYFPFIQGMLYVGNDKELSPESMELVHALGEAFSTAFARYEDFKKLEIAKQKVEKTLKELKEAQKLLIQSEKMASLGELTAGIAHEIQNPLNFVNNFSDVSNELIDEMKEELEKGDIAMAVEISNDLKVNLSKIIHHGKRADAIVKGMLEHSRNTASDKNPTNINALADEFLRLSYHGLRAKDKSFSADFETDLDPNLPPMNVVAQDIGRVVLNLINNAFYAVGQKAKTFTESGNTAAAYYPKVTVQTRMIDLKGNAGGVEICIKDNGGGIPKAIKDKIFQPFFTTKPTGSGTGLGLSLSYDIVKAHGGDLRVKSTEGEGTEMIIFLPNENL